jgi:hypothetical protein
MPTYERIFEKRATGELQGREFLKKYYPQQWRIYSMNLKSVTTWFSNIEDPRIRSFFSTTSLPICGIMRILRQMSRISSRNTVGL